MRQVVLGAGPLGDTLAGRLLAEGEDVALFSVMGNPAYDMPGTAPASIDGTVLDEVQGACDGADVVYLCLNAHYVDWYELFPPRLAAAITTASATGARLVYHDSVYLYGKSPGPVTEDMPYAATTRKGKLQAEMATTMLEAARSGRIRGVIGRTADMYGPGALNSSFNSTLGQRHFYPMLAGKSVSVLGDIDAPHTYAYVDDVARGLQVLAQHDEALGQAWHIPAAPTLSHRELLTLAAEVAAVPPRVRGSKVSGYFVRVIGRFQKDVGEVAELLYAFERPLEVSHAKFEETFGFESTPHNEALRRTLDWYQSNPLT